MNVKGKEVRNTKLKVGEYAEKVEEYPTKMSYHSGVDEDRSKIRRNNYEARIKVAVMQCSRLLEI